MALVDAVADDILVVTREWLDRKGEFGMCKLGMD